MRCSIALFIFLLLLVPVKDPEDDPSPVEIAVQRSGLPPCRPIPAREQIDQSLAEAMDGCSRSNPVDEQLMERENAYVPLRGKGDFHCVLGT